MIKRRKPSCFGCVSDRPSHRLIRHLYKTERNLFRRELDRRLCIDFLCQLLEFARHNLGI